MACGSGESAPHILHLDTRQKWWLSSPRERAHSIQRLNGPQNWSRCLGLKQDAPASNQTQIMWCPAHSLATSPCKINACKINMESKNTCQTTKLSSLPPPLSGTSLQVIYRPLSYIGWPMGVRRFSKKKLLGRFSTWNGFIFTKLKVKTCHLSYVFKYEK